MTVKELNAFCKNSFIELLGIQFTEFDDTHIYGFIEVNQTHLQPLSYVSGGVFISLAETLAGAGSTLLVEKEGKIAFGTSVNSQHITSVKEGKILGKGTLISKGIFKHIWDVEITDESNKLISISRVTNSIKDLNQTKEQ